MYDTRWYDYIWMALVWVLCIAISLAFAAACVYYGAGLAHLGWKAVH
jgi:hypothetical protein